MFRTVSVLALAGATLFAQEGGEGNNRANCRDLPSHTLLKIALASAVRPKRISRLPSDTLSPSRRGDWATTDLTP